MFETVAATLNTAEGLICAIQHRLRYLVLAHLDLFRISTFGFRIFPTKSCRSQCDGEPPVDFTDLGSGPTSLDDFTAHPIGGTGSGTFAFS